MDGTIEAQAGSSVRLIGGAWIDGGRMVASGGGVIETGGSFVDIVDLELTGTLRVNNGHAVRLQDLEKSVGHLIR